MKYPDECKSIEVHLITLYANGNNAKYLHRFRVEYIPEEIKKQNKGYKSTTNISRIQAWDWIICGYIGES